jgi:hypothetical protein
MNALTAHRARKRAKTRAAAPANMRFVQGIRIQSDLRLIEAMIREHNTNLVRLIERAGKESPWT